MARILVAALPAFGLANPSLPLIRALVDGGHHVDVLQGEAFRGGVERAGATLLPFGFYLDGALTEPRQLIRYGRRLFADMAAAMITLGPRYDALIGTGMQPHLTEVERAVDRPVIFASPVFFQNDRTARHFADIAVGLPAPVRRLLRTPALRRVAGAGAGAAVFGTDVGDIIDLLGMRSSSLNLTVATREYQPYPDDFPGGVFLGPTPTQRRPDPEFPIERVRGHDGPVIYGTLGTVFNTFGEADQFRASSTPGADTTAGSPPPTLTSLRPSSPIHRHPSGGRNPRSEATRHRCSGTCELPRGPRQERAFGTPNGRPDHVLGDFGSVSSTVRPSGSRMTKDQ